MTVINGGFVLKILSVFCLENHFVYVHVSLSSLPRSLTFPPYLGNHIAMLLESQHFDDSTNPADQTSTQTKSIIRYDSNFDIAN